MINERSAFGIIHKATEYYDDGFSTPGFAAPAAPKKKLVQIDAEDVKETGKTAAAGAAGGAAVLGAAGGVAYKKARPAIKAYKGVKNFLAGKP